MSHGERISAGLGVFLLVLGVGLATGSGHLSVQDEVGLYHMTASVLETGSFSVPRSVNTGGGFVGLDGRYYTPFGIGQPLLAAPLLAWARILLPPRAQPYLEVTVLLAFNAFVSAATAAVLAVFLMELGASRRRAVVLALVAALATHALAYGRTYFAEPLTGLLGLLVVRSLGLARQGLPGHALAAGVLAGYAVLVRFFSVLLLPVYALYLLGPAPARWRRTFTFTAAAAVFVLISLWRNHVLLGAWDQTGYRYLPDGSVRGFTHPLLPGLAILLLAPGKSLFVFAPPVLLGLWCWPAWLRRRPAEALLVLAVAAVYLAGYAQWCSPEGGASWGPRFVVPVVPLLMLPLAEAAWSRCKSTALAGLAAAGLAVGLLALPVDAARRMGARAQELYTPEGRYNFWFSPFADHLQELARIWRNVLPEPGTVGRSRLHLVPQWSGEPDLWAVHLLREGHAAGRVAAVLGVELLIGIAGGTLLLRPPRLGGRT
jgi:hypothetical protein